MKTAIKTLSEGKNLSREEAKRVMDIMLSGEATQAQIGAYLTALRMKGETIDEIVGSATVLKEKAVHIHPSKDVYVDLVGTGGDGSNSFNISTTSAFVCAGAGLSVAKHGNRAISSKSGAGDVLEALGVNIVSEPSKVEESVNNLNIGFMFAQTFNKSMKFVGQARSEMGIRTIFNVLGPLANPSGAKYMMLGVYNKNLTEVIASSLKEMGVLRALVVSGFNGMDEITTTDLTQISELKDGEVKTYTVEPEDFGFKRVNTEEILGGDALLNAKITKSILMGEDKGAKRDIVLLNSGATLYVSGYAKSIAEGINLAAKSIDSGNAIKALENLVAFSNK
jgi:anthranilate phosphoribosyltransferase